MGLTVSLATRLGACLTGDRFREIEGNGILNQKELQPRHSRECWRVLAPQQFGQDHFARRRLS